MTFCYSPLPPHRYQSGRLLASLGGDLNIWNFWWVENGDEYDEAEIERFMRHMHPGRCGYVEDEPYAYRDIAKRHDPKLDCRKFFSKEANQRLDEAQARYEAQFKKPTGNVIHVQFGGG